MKFINVLLLLPTFIVGLSSSHVKRRTKAPKVAMGEEKIQERSTLFSTRRSLLQKGALAFLAASSTFALPSNAVGGNIVYGSESIMSPKAHGTTETMVQDDLLYGADKKLADRICSYNRHFAEMCGYFRSTNFEDVVLNAKQPITFYDSVTGKPLFQAPIGRSAQEFIDESRIHGWPSFRDQEVVWDNVRVLRDGETVSLGKSVDLDAPLVGEIHFCPLATHQCCYKMEHTWDTTCQIVEATAIASI
jgi:hypothetical protein